MKSPNSVIRMSKVPNTQLFGYSDEPKNQIFGYLVTWLLGYLVTWLLVYSGHPKKSKETKFGNPKTVGEPCQKLESLVRESQYFWRKFWQNPKSQTFARYPRLEPNELLHGHVMADRHVIGLVSFWWLQSFG
jgi:hypothetical protein